VDGEDRIWNFSREITLSSIFSIARGKVGQVNGGSGALCVESGPSFFGGAGLAGDWDAAKAGIVGQEEVAGVEGVGFKAGVVGGDQEPVVDLAAEDGDSAERREFFLQGFAGEVGCFGEDQPEAVVVRYFGAFAEHHYDLVAEVDGEAGEHAADFGMEWGESFEDEGVGWGISPGVRGLHGY
jgi:hypothetical protein